MSKEWVVRETVKESEAQELSDYPEIIKKHLFYRGIKNKIEAEKFLNPKYEDLFSSFDILGIDKATERILSAITNKERIVVFSDYDADGVSAATVFYDFFEKIGFENYHIHISDRQIEGYGLNLNVIEEIVAQKANLVLTLDCGITDCEEIKILKEKNIDVIVIDHHLASGEMPCALAIVDSKQKEDTYPFKDLCGAATAFKVVDVLIKKGDAKKMFNITSGWEKWLLDLIAIASVADMVPLLSENRILVKFGLQVLRKTKRIGLQSLFKKLNLSQKDIAEDDIAFMIAPRINISSRMGHASASFDLLTTESLEEGTWIANKLDLMNNERKNVVDIITKTVFEKFPDVASAPAVIVVGDKSWRPGVLGLAATKIVERYRRPTFIWGQGEAREIKGSCRGDGSVNLVDLMSMIKPGVLLNTGGHFMAGGYSIADGFEGELEDEVLKNYAKAQKHKTELDKLFIDQEISIDDVNWEFYSIIEKLSPFGYDNPKPNFLLKDLVVANVKKFGNGGIHLQLDFKNQKGKNVSAIGFFATEENLNIVIGQKIDLVATVEKSTFRNFPELRLRIVDLKVK